jgi:hypothetical protein
VRAAAEILNICRVGRCGAGLLDALDPLHAAGASDLEFGASVRERNERRRRLLSVLVRRMAADRKLRPRMLDDLIDVLFALTSFPFFSQLTARGRSAQAACDLIQGLATDAVRRALTGQKRH